MKAIDVHGFGGGFTLGMVQAGFTLAAKFSTMKGFGVYNCLANRTLLGNDWDSIVDVADRWHPMQAEVVFGNPPCSGFSTLSRADFRGEDSAANAYMWELAEYAGRVGPQIVIFESVQQTFRQGLGLMRRLHARIEELSGHKYALRHVLHNNASLGGVSNRRRYFFVASRCDFGVGHYPLRYVPTFGDMLHDLENLGLTMAAQPYKGVRHIHTEECNIWMSARPSEWECQCPVEVMNSSQWCREFMHDGTGWVDGHDVTRSPSFDRTQELAQLEEWKAGESISDVLRRYYQKHGNLPRGWYYDTKEFVLGENGQKLPVLDEDGEQIFDPRTRRPLWQQVTMPKAVKLIKTNFNMGHNQQVRWHSDRPANVITGGACHLVVHPTLPRTLTQREAARVQGFPDSWKIYPVRNAPDLGPGWGKGVPVQAGKWIGEWAAASLGGNPGPLRGQPLAAYDKKLGQKYGAMNNELIIDVTNDWKQFFPRR